MYTYIHRHTQTHIDIDRHIHIDIHIHIPNLASTYATLTYTHSNTCISYYIHTVHILMHIIYAYLYILFGLNCIPPPQFIF